MDRFSRDSSGYMTRCEKLRKKRVSCWDEEGLDEEGLDEEGLDGSRHTCDLSCSWAETQPTNQKKKRVKNNKSARPDARDTAYTRTLFRAPCSSFAMTRGI